MKYASDEKVRLLRVLLPTLALDEQIAAELPFRDVRHKADLAILSPTRLAAFEIKGARDNLTSLPSQLAAYQDMFLEVTVAVASKYLAAVRALTPKDVGIVELGETIQWKRQPKRRTTLSKAAALAWLHSKDLAKLGLPAGVRARGVTSMRMEAEKVFPAKHLTEVALKAICARNQGRYEAFLSERSLHIDHDDLMMLTLPHAIR